MNGYDVEFWTLVKAVVAAFNQEKALVGASCVILQLHRLIVPSTTQHIFGGAAVCRSCQLAAAG